jgi:hypothetical protein
LCRFMQKEKIDTDLLDRFDYCSKICLKSYRKNEGWRQKPANTHRGNSAFRIAIFYGFQTANPSQHGTSNLQ